MSTTTRTPWRADGTHIHDATGRVIATTSGGLAPFIAAAPETAAERDRLREQLEKIARFDPQSIVGVEMAGLLTERDRLTGELAARTRQVERWQHAAHGGCSSGPDGALLCEPASPGDFARAVNERDRLQAENAALVAALRDSIALLQRVAKRARELPAMKLQECNHGPAEWDVGEAYALAKFLDELAALPAAEMTASAALAAHDAMGLPIPTGG